MTYFVCYYLVDKIKKLSILDRGSLNAKRQRKAYDFLFAKVNHSYPFEVSFLFKL